MKDDRAAERIIRRFARASNLMVAGRWTRVHRDSGSTVADALEGMLARLGGLPATGSGPFPGLVEFFPERESDATVLLDGAPLPERGDAQGRIAFAREHMPVSASLAAGLDLEGIRIGVAMVLEPKTAVLALLLRDAGAEVSVYAHPDETDPAVALALRELGFPVTADPALHADAERAAATAFLRAGLDVLLDDGSHLIRLAHEVDPALPERWIGACEETTSGLTPLRAMEQAGALRAAVMAVNDAKMKSCFDNRHGTAQSCVFAIADLLEEAGSSLHAQPALVIGYGPVGEGVAAVLRALGVEVSVAEANPLRALRARHHGFVTASARRLAAGRLVISATGAPATVTPEIREVAAVVAVAGGIPGEVVVPAEAGIPLVPGVVSLSGGTLLLGDGGAVNITAAEGNPIEIMDLSFAVQLAALQELLLHRPGPGVHPLSAEADDRVAHAAVRARGISLDPSSAPSSSVSDDWRSPRYRRGNL